MARALLYQGGRTVISRLLTGPEAFPSASAMATSSFIRPDFALANCTAGMPSGVGVHVFPSVLKMNLGWPGFPMEEEARWMMKERCFQDRVMRGSTFFSPSGRTIPLKMTYVES